jgi:hypothetical protein
VLSEDIARRRKNDNPTISLPPIHVPITAGASQVGASRGLRRDSSKAKQLKRYITYKHNAPLTRCCSNKNATRKCETKNQDSKWVLNTGWSAFLTVVGT